MAIDELTLKFISENIEKRGSVFLSAQGVDVLFQTYLLAVRDNTVVVANTVTPALISRVAKAKRFFLQIRMIQFESSEITSDGVNIVFPLESLNIFEENRQAERFPFDAEERVVIEFLNPYDQETLLQMPVMDMSATGLSIRSAFDSDLLVSGQIFPAVKVLIDAKVYRAVDCQIVYKRRFLARDAKMHFQVGLKFLGEP